MPANSNHPQLTGLHILLTYQCTFECDHCFVWGSPRQTGTLTFDRIEEVLAQAFLLGTIREVYFEGGEPFLFYPILLQAVRRTHELGFSTGVVSNAYWALSLRDAKTWLYPFTGQIDDLSVSSDLFHYDRIVSLQAEFAMAAASDLGIPVGVIRIDIPELQTAQQISGVIPSGSGEEGSAVMYRGRAAVELAPKAPKFHWREFRSCPHEDLQSPGRIHLDPFGNLHICQGISIGNLLERSLKEIWENFNPLDHPITGPIIDGGPVMLVEKYDLPHSEEYADACHLCYQSRLSLRDRFPEYLTPDQMYGIM